MDRLPSLPALYVEVVEQLKDPNTSLEAVGALMAQDMAMTAKILKLVNSAFFGLGRQISSAAEAATYLGLDTIKSLVLSIHVFSQYANQPGGFSIEALWAHSQSTAGLAKEIARLEEAGTKVMDEAFVAGLLHDTGKLVLASNFPLPYARVFESSLSSGIESLSAEERLFGANHAEVAGYLLGLWGLPIPVVEAVALHHHPRKCSHVQFSPLTAVHAADVLAHWQTGTDDAPAGDACDLEYLRALGLEGRLEHWRAAAEANLPDQLLKT
jgi:HD-like signal output (HDOD) protein